MNNLYEICPKRDLFPYSFVMKKINQSVLKYKSSLFLTNDQIIIGKSNVTVGK